MSLCFGQTYGVYTLSQNSNSVLLKPRASTEFDCLQHTFLSQISHRDDFRERLATLYGEWRSHMGEGLASDLVPNANVSPRALATFVQAILHGLSVQLMADPNAFDRQEVLALTVRLLEPFFRSATQPAVKPDPNSAKKNGTHRRMRPRTSIPR